MARRSAFARNGSTSPLGKIQPPLGQLRLHQLVDERVREAAAKAGKPVLEYLRDYIEVGFARKEIEHAHTIYLDRFAALLPNGNQTATAGDD